MAQSSDKTFFRSEVAKFNHSKDAKIIIHNSVYDVTGFLNEHPGGEEALLEHAGKDGTEAFEDTAHSSDARELMKKYKVGELDPRDRIETDKKARDWANSLPDDDHRSWKSWMIPVSLAILGTIIYRFYFTSVGH